MFGIKVTPFILFLILLITLVISMLFGNSWLLSKRITGLEGFQSFGYSSNYPGLILTVHQYSASNNIVSLHDNLYFDPKNSNLVETDSPYCGNVHVGGSSIGGNISCNDSTGSTITQMWVTKNNGSTTQIQVSSTPSSTLTSLSSASLNPQIGQYPYLSNSQNIASPSMPGYRYQLFNISWGPDTYMHLMGLDPNSSTNSGTNLKSFYYNNSGAMMRHINFTPTTVVPPYNQVSGSTADPNNDTLYVDNGYNSGIKIFQISKYVKYDILNGFVIIGTSSGSSGSSYTVYNRETGSVANTSSPPGSIKNLSNYVSWIVSDGNNGMVVVMAFGLQTVILCLHADLNYKWYNITSTSRFTDKAYVISLVDSNNSYLNESTSDNDSKTDSSDNSMPCNDELSCKWYYYFKTIGNDPSVLFKNDFIRKTQIVPPVCPQCPNCPGSGVCGSCGGNGGSGTRDGSGSLLRDVGRGADNLLRDTASGTVDLAKDTVGGTVGLAKDTVGGAVGLVKDTVGGAVGLVKDTVGGTVNLAGDVVGGAVDLTKQAVGGLGHGYNRQQSDSGFGYVPGQGYTPVDNYSAYGAIQSKGSNFMPVTASFAAFGK